VNADVSDWMLGASDEPAIRDAGPEAAWNRPQQTTSAAPAFVPLPRKRKSKARRWIILAVVLAGLVALGTRLGTVIPMVESWLRGDPPATADLDPEVLTSATTRVGSDEVGYIDVPAEWMTAGATTLPAAISAPQNTTMRAWQDPGNRRSAVALAMYAGTRGIELVADSWETSILAGDATIEETRVRLLGRGAIRLVASSPQTKTITCVWVVGAEDGRVFQIVISVPEDDTAALSLVDSFAVHD
jgi:hypothetical protein